ncbi:hypothetical protein B0H13DRAFT_2284406 [Mycena leptocephala]|nr:hypothetical protein B0H13DRAFT_2284406 [Mycena leptocephala]
MPKVEDVGVWLRWAVDPASALRSLPPLLAPPMHFLLPLLRPYLPLPLQGVGNHFMPFLLSHPTPAPERLSAAIVRPELVPTIALPQGPDDLALLAYSVVFFSFLRLVLSHSLFPMLASKWGIRKVARFREQGYAVLHFFGGGGLGAGNASSRRAACTSCLPFPFALPPHHLSSLLTPSSFRRSVLFPSPFPASSLLLPSLLAFKLPSK